MKKIIFQCVGNAVLFTLFGLAFLFPLSGISQNENILSGTITCFPIMFVGYLIIYPIANYIISKIFRWNKKDNSELAFSDEREKLIVAQKKPK